MSITIYHNPSCGTSRNTLAMIRRSGEEPEIIEYLKAPPTRERLIELLCALRMRPRELLRRKGTPYEELRLDDAKWTDDELIAVMLEHPILINRPIVVTPKGVRLCRPSEVVLEILPNPNIGEFTKEDGEVICSCAPKWKERVDGATLSAAATSPAAIPDAPRDAKRRMRLSLVF
jgi:arsenate reductase (glutaredoxin)